LDTRSKTGESDRAQGLGSAEPFKNVIAAARRVRATHRPWAETPGAHHQDAATI